MQLSNYAEDAEKQEQGSPYYLDDGVFYVMRLGTPDSAKQIEEIKKRLYGFAPKDIDQNEIMAHWLAEYGVTNWDGILNGDDELAYSKKAARQVFLNPAYKLSLNALLINHAADYANYLSDEVERDVDEVKKS